MTRCSYGIFGCMILPSLISTAHTADFEEARDITRQSEEIEFARNTQGTCAIDSLGRLHIVYAAPDESTDPPQDRVWYQMVPPDGSPELRVRVDDGRRGGGRHPELAIDGDDGIQVVWQDFRHSTAAGNGFDNIEIYYDRKPRDGSFASEDIRITHTQAGHLGDSGYMPMVATGTDGRVHIAWHDFTINGNNADVYFRSSNDAGEFPSHVGIEEYRITDAVSGDGFASNWMPSLGILDDGSVYVVWGFLTGWQGAFDLQGRIIDAAGTQGNVEVFGEGGFFLDPPRLDYDQSGNLGLVYTARMDGQSQVRFQYRPVGGPWSEPLLVSSGDIDAEQPDVALDSIGAAHLVWQEDLGGEYEVHFASLDPVNGALDARQVLSTPETDARTPVIAVHPNTDRIHVVWIERSFENENERAIVLRSERLTRIHEWVQHGAHNLTESSAARARK